MYLDGYKGRLRTTMIALVDTRIGYMRNTRLDLNSMDLGHSRYCDENNDMLRTIRVP